MLIASPNFIRVGITPEIKPATFPKTLPIPMLLFLQLCPEKGVDFAELTAQSPEVSTQLSTKDQVILAITRDLLFEVLDSLQVPAPPSQSGPDLFSHLGPEPADHEQASRRNRPPPFEKLL